MKRSANQSVAVQVNDTTRLDWLQERRYWAQATDHNFFIVNRKGFDVANSATLRDAIDAAMRSEKGKK